MRILAQCLASLNAPQMSAMLIIRTIIIVITAALVVSEVVLKWMAPRRTMAKDTFWGGRWLGASD